MKRGLEYYHCALWENGAWTIRPERDSAEKLADLTRWIDTQANQKPLEELDIEAYE